MQSSTRLVNVIAAAALLGGTACSNDSRALSGDRDGGEGGTRAPSGLNMIWRIVESGPLGTALDEPLRPQDLPGLAGVEVCVDRMDAIPCATTASDGTFVLRGLPTRTDLVLTTRKDGYVKTLRAIETASTDMDGTAFPLVTTKSGGPRPDLGFTYDDNLGAVSFFALEAEADGGAALPSGIRASLNPGTAHGPFYTTDRNAFVRSATASIGGLGFFFNVEPGEYQLVFDDSQADCAPISFPFGAFGYPAPPTSVRFPVQSGYVTDQIAVLCTQKSVLVSTDAGGRADGSRDR